jgi:hypothetical protein
MVSVQNANPDPAFYLSGSSFLPIRIQLFTYPAPGSLTIADLSGSGSWSDFAVTKKVEACHEKYR